MLFAGPRPLDATLQLHGRVLAKVLLGGDDHLQSRCCGHLSIGGEKTVHDQSHRAWRAVGLAEASARHRSEGMLDDVPMPIMVSMKNINANKC